jgi:hypothetical protein
LISSREAAGWTWEFFEENDVAISEAVSNKPVPYVAEVRARCVRDTARTHLCDVRDRLVRDGFRDGDIVLLEEFPR